MNLTNNPVLLEQLVELTDCLHRDEEIRSHLRGSGPGRTYLKYFVETYIDRFTGDLETIATSQLPFISSILLAWMQGETGRLHQSENGFVERIKICFRAQLLDEVIDPLADYIEARAVPSRREEVQQVKRKRHEEALEKYQMTWRG